MLQEEEEIPEKDDERRSLYEQKTSFEDTVVDFKPKYYTV